MGFTNSTGTGTGRKVAPRLAFLAQVHEEFGQVKIKAHVMHPAPDTDTDRAEYPLHSVSWSIGGYGPGAEFDGFAVTAYVGHGGNTWGTRPSFEESGVWGLGYEYSPHRVESARQAQAIARVMSKVERGLRRADTTDGYLPDGSYAPYLVRIARTLGVKDLYVGAHRRTRTVTGERYRKVDAPALQHWVADVVESVQKNSYRDDFISR